MIDLSSRLTELLAERELPLRKRAHTLVWLDRQIALCRALIWLEREQDRRDMAETLRPHVTGNIRVAA